MADPKYGYRHQQERLKWKRIVDQGDAVCCLCGRPLPPGAAFHLDHLPGTDQYRGVACPKCNTADGGRRRHRPKVVTRWTL
jgi:hypothetical protein